jgi:hypothetical protein
MNYGQTEPAPPTRVEVEVMSVPQALNEIDIAIAGLKECLEHAFDRAERLVARIDPVLRDSTPGDAMARVDGGIKEESSGPALVRGLLERADHIRSVADALVRLGRILDDSGDRVLL